MSVTCRQIMNYIERIAPLHLAEEWDNVGLLLGSPEQEVRHILVTLDVTDAVLSEAVACSADMIVSHHPPIFSPLKNLCTDTPQGRLLTRCIQTGIPVYAAHTNLDSAAEPVNGRLAKQLGVGGTVPLHIHYEEDLLKIVVFIPADHVGAVRTAMTDAGAGHIGQYSHCTFASPGTGTFLPLAGTQPFIGSQDQLASVEEYKLETIVPAGRLSAVLQAMRAAHPYEEAAYDVIPLRNTGRKNGFGWIGRLDNPVSLEAMADRVKHVLGLERLKVAGPPEQRIETVAYCGGGGSSFLRQAIAGGADVYISGDMSYHHAQDACAAGMAIIDAGHYATEFPLTAYLAECLRGHSAREGWSLSVAVAQGSTDVFQVW